MTLLHRRPTPGKASPSHLHTAVEPSSPPPRPSTSLDSLPTELHLLIASHLPYPDALSLKHTSRHFYRLVDTGVRLKVAWLISRHELHLDCPNDSRCDLRNDSNFCRGSVRFVSPPEPQDHPANLLQPSDAPPEATHRMRVPPRPRLPRLRHGHLRASPRCSGLSKVVVLIAQERRCRVESHGSTNEHSRSRPRTCHPADELGIIRRKLVHHTLQLSPILDPLA